MRRVLNLLRRIFLCFLFLPLILFIWGNIMVRFYDESLEPGLEEYFAIEAVPDQENGFVALMGIDAPSDDQMVEYGIKKMSAAVRDMSLIENTITFDEKRKCWPSPWLDDFTEPACFTDKQLSVQLANKQKFINHYQALYNYPRFVGYSKKYGSLVPHDFIYIHQLFLADLWLSAVRDGAPAAMDRWIADTRFIQRVMSDVQGINGKATILSIYSTNLRFFPLLAAKLTPEELSVRQVELDQIFCREMLGAEGWDLRNSMRVDYELFYDWKQPREENQQMEMNSLSLDKKETESYKISFKPNVYANLFYECAKDVEERAHQTPEEFFKDPDLLKKKWDATPDSVIGFYTHLLFLGINPDRQSARVILGNNCYGIDPLLSAAHYNMVRRLMLKLYLDAKIHKIPATEMPAFLKASSIQNPITGTSFLWDETKHLIYFNDVLGNQQTVEY